MGVKTLFLDVGGVLLTNGWDTQSRMRAAKEFNLDFEEMNKRHALLFDTYEIGKMSLDDYIQGAVFYQPRSFTMDQFKTFMFSQSQPHQEMIELMKKVKKEKNLLVLVLSNEGRELTEHRITAFKLKEFVDIFIVSSFVYLRKPDEDIYRLAIDICQNKPEDILYIDDRPLLVEIGKRLGLKTIQHQNCEKTKKELDSVL